MGKYISLQTSLVEYLKFERESGGTELFAVGVEDVALNEVLKIRGGDGKSLGHAQR